MGAAPEHASTLVLTNPDGGPAVAEVTVLGPDGVVDVPDLRGVTVRGGRTSRFDLSQVVPTREDLTLQVVVTRGRLGVDVEDLVDELGGGTRAEDWLPGQAAPATTSYLAGLGDGPADRTLTLANPGENEARVDVRLVTGESEFEPAGVDEIRVPAGSVTSLDVSRLLRGKVASGALAVRLDASEPVTASVRSLAGDDLYHSVAGATLEDLAAAALPQGGKRLVVVGASAPGVLTWRALDEDGAEIRQKRVEVDPGRGVRVKLPDDARMVQVRVERATVVAAVEVGPPGWAVIPLTPLEDASLVPDVRPALR